MTTFGEWNSQTTSLINVESYGTMGQNICNEVILVSGVLSPLSGPVSNSVVYIWRQHGMVGRPLGSGSFTHPTPGGRVPCALSHPCGSRPRKTGYHTHFAQSQCCEGEMEQCFEGTWNQEGKSPIHKCKVFINHQQRQYPRSQLPSSISCTW